MVRIHKISNKPDKMSELKLRWIEEAEKQLIGRKIVSIRYLTDEEVRKMGWQHSCVLLALDDGSAIYPSSDDEGNDAGALFGQTKNDEEFALPVI